VLPSGVRRLVPGRLFPNYDESDLLAGGRPTSLLIARLLEDGDGADLAWLTETVAEEELAAWLERHGGRQLSRRSRAFWEIVLGTSAGPVPETGGLLWPL
jgi:hypothetical protein